VDDLSVISPDWMAPPRVSAAFTLRTGGVSAAPYDSLNLGSRIGDSLEGVAENRRRVREALRLPAEPMWLEQVHGIAVVEAQAGRAGFNTPPTGDAVVAREAGQVCAIRVADCMPVLFAARDGSVVGAAHAGWRGLAGGVLEATVARLGVPASEVIAWMGPAIGPRHFEVGDDVRAAFLAAGAGAGVRASIGADTDGVADVVGAVDRARDGVASAFTANARGRWQCDLYALARLRLQALGIVGIHGGGWCTFAEADRFFSYRRDGQCGRMAALIWIQPGQD
jgi:YfiH family protein